MVGNLPTSEMCNAYVEWKEKLKQRTETFLALDALRRDMDYEDWETEEVVLEYIERFKEIIEADDKKGLENSELTGRFIDNIEKEYGQKE